MGHVTNTRYFCDWCKTDLTHRLGKGVFSLKLFGDEICAACEKELRVWIKSRHRG